MSKMNPQQAAAAGLNWVDETHPYYGKAGFVGSNPAAPSPSQPSSPFSGADQTMAKPLSAPASAPAPAPGAAPAPAPAQPAAEMTPQQAVAAGLNYVPKDHPYYGKPGFVGSTPASGGAAPAATGAAPQTVQGAFQQALLSQLQQNQQPPTMADPTIKAQSQAYNVAQTRATERAREAMAERAAAGGQLSDRAGSGQLSEGLMALLERQGESQAGFDAGLLGKELESRRNQLLSYVALAGNQLNAEDTRALQRELAELDAEIRRSGLESQTRLGQQELALRDKLGSGQLNLGLLGLRQSGDQFNKNLGFQSGLASANLNQNALLSLLNGL